MYYKNWIQRWCLISHFSRLYSVCRRTLSQKRQKLNEKQRRNLADVCKEACLLNTVFMCVKPSLQCLLRLWLVAPGYQASILWWPHPALLPGSEKASISHNPTFLRLVSTPPGNRTMNLFTCVTDSLPFHTLNINSKTKLLTFFLATVPVLTPHEIPFLRRFSLCFLFRPTSIDPDIQLCVWCSQLYQQQLSRMTLSLSWTQSWTLTSKHH